MVGTPMRHYLSVTCPACSKEVACAYETYDSTYAGLDYIHARCKHCDCEIAVDAHNIEKYDAVTKDVITAEYIRLEQRRLQKNTKQRDKHRALPKEERLAIHRKYNNTITAKRRAKGGIVRIRRSKTI